MLNWTLELDSNNNFKYGLAHGENGLTYSIHKMPLGGFDLFSYDPYQYVGTFSTMIDAMKSVGFVVEVELDLINFEIAKGGF